MIEEGHAYVLDLVVKVPSDAVAPIKYNPTETDATNQIADEREQRKQVTFDCSKQLCGGRRSERGRQVQAWKP